MVSTPQSLVETAPPISMPGSPALEIAMGLLWEYAVAEDEDAWADRAVVYEEHAPVDPDDWYAATAWIDEEGLAEVLETDESRVVAHVTPLGRAMLRWWGWEDVERLGNPDAVRAGDFVVVREPATRRYYVIACGDEREGECVMLTLLGPEGGASSPSSAAMWARRMGGPDARVWLIERRDVRFPISRVANALATKERLRSA